MRYSRLLEENSYANKKADYVWLLIVCSSMLLVSLPLGSLARLLALTGCSPCLQLISPVFTVPILSGSLAFALVYIWSRRNPTVQMSLMGIVTWVARSHHHPSLSAWLTTTNPHQRLCVVSPALPLWFLLGRSWEME